MDRQLNANEVALLVGCTVPTLTSWYKWRDLHPDDEKAKLLPDYIRVDSPQRGKRLWKYSDIPSLILFKSQIKQGRGGFMSEITQKYVKKEK